ncbi:MAG: OmpA family protein, partial [Rhodobacteraceae bacterium]|nr:OmpA family protein [Paracoccaceae bacterium]
PVMEEPATDEAVTEDPATDEAVTEEPATEEATTEEAPTEEATTEDATTGEAASGEAATDETVTEEPATADPATADPATGEAVTEEPATEEATTEDSATGEAATEEPAATEDPATAEATEEAAVEETAPPTLTLPEPTAEVVDPAAGLKTAEPATDAAEVTPVEAPEVTEAEIESLSEILTQPDAIAPGALEAAASFNGLGDKAKTEEPPVPVADLPVPDDAKVVIETLTDTQTRRSDQEFAAAPVALGEGKKSGLSDLEKAGLVVLGALVVGAIINEGRKDRQEVVSNTGDRIVVLKPDGTYQVYKDDDAPLRQPGSTVRTETYRDGSTRTIIERTDGTQIVTVRDASGRVLRRAQYDRLGREIVLIDDFWEEEPVVVRDLPKPRKDRVTISTADENAALKAALAAKEAAKAGRKFTLRQIREIPEVRALAATIDVESVTFDSGSSAIKATEAASLAELGGLMQDLLDANPAEVFLIEGHTDAVGNAAMNLALSDRRAESVALALTEYFDIPPENMVVQGYGESELKIDTQKDERRNRRVVVRVITPLMKTGK